MTLTIITIAVCVLTILLLFGFVLMTLLGFVPQVAVLLVLNIMIFGQIITLITIPVTFYSLVCGKDLISLVYKTRNFDENSVLKTLGVFRFHIAGLFFIAVNRIITPAFYSQSNTKLPTLAGIISFGVNIVLAIVFSIFMKGNGIALALSISSVFNTIFLFIFMKKMPSMDYKQIAKKMFLYIIKMITI